MNMSLSCIRNVITNGCGHTASIRYKHCGNHLDDSDENKRCFIGSHSATKPVAVTVAVGSTFCGRECRAMTVGWMCCTCGFKEVFGTIHNGADMLVHVASNGKLHGFCDTCRDVCQSTTVPAVRHVAELADTSRTSSTYSNPSRHVSTSNNKTRTDNVSLAPPPLSVKRRGAQHEHARPDRRDPKTDTIRNSTWFSRRLRT